MLLLFWSAVSGAAVATPTITLSLAPSASVTLQTAQATPSIRLRLLAVANPFGTASPSITLALAPVLARQPAQASPRITLALAPVLARQPAQATPSITLALALDATRRFFVAVTPSIRLSLECHAIGGFTPAGGTVIEMEYNATGSTVTTTHRTDYEQTGVSTVTLSHRE